MKTFEYADSEISSREIMFTVPSMIIGVGILTLPRNLATVTYGSDGWISIVLAGLLTMIFTLIVAKLASRFPKETFYSYTSKILSKTIAKVLTLFISIHFIFYTAYEIRIVSVISKEYLLDRTPEEVISFVFLLTLIYAVSGDRVGLLRLNMMFFPIIFLITVIVALLNIPIMEVTNFAPFFETSFSGYIKGIKESFFSFAGFEILLFYIAFMNNPKLAPKYAVIGISITILLYLILLFATLGVFSYLVSAELVFPVIEMAKELEVPGGFFERFDSVFFTIWIMALFNTAAMAYDVAVLAFTSVFGNVKKVIVVFIYGPIVYVIGMFPQNFNEITFFATMISYSGLAISIILPILLLLIAKLRRIQGNG